MESKSADGVLMAAADFFTGNTTLAFLAVGVGWGLGWVLGFALARGTQNRTAAALSRRICPVLGVMAALPLAYKLMFHA